MKVAGKSRNAILVAAMHKIIRIAEAMLRTQTNFKK